MISNLKEFPQLHQIVKSSFFVFIALSGFLNTVEVEHLWHEQCVILLFILSRQLLIFFVRLSQSRST